MLFLHILRIIIINILFIETMFSKIHFHILQNTMMSFIEGKLKIKVHISLKTKTISQFFS